MTVDVAVVGGGPAGAVTAALLARAGREVVLLERTPAWRWRACGVFTSPATRIALRRIGLDDEHLEAIARPIPAMRGETPRGTRVRLTYGASDDSASQAFGLDRGGLDDRLLELATVAGAEVRRGAQVTAVARDGEGLRLGFADSEALTARVVVGADGLRSIVARGLGIVRPSPLGRRFAMTFHVADPWGIAPHDARMVVIDDGYVGLAPVPGGRVNVGIVLGRRWADELRRDGARAVAGTILGSIAVDDTTLGAGEPLDEVAGVSPLGHDVERRSGPGWLLVGDAAGFLDPFTGEGLHRAVRSAELAAEVIDGALRSGGRNGTPGLGAYDRAMAHRYRAKDLVTRIVHLFLVRPRLFEYAARRLAARAEVRETLGLVIGDLVPARRALDPRYLTRLLAP